MPLFIPNPAAVADIDLLPLVINVKDAPFNAKGNGIADDTVAIQAAINSVPFGSRGVIFFPVGNYMISATLIINNDSISLVSMGQRSGAATISILPGFDPSYALIVGNTRNADSCLISGMGFIGRNSTTSTGKGILFRSNGGKIVQTKVVYFGGNGVEVGAFSGTVYEIFFEDVELAINGMNSTTPGDNLVINGGASDCEYHRVISQGDVAKSTTNNCITLNGAGQQKFVDCHCYFARNDGFLINSGFGCQLLGGEYETNGLNGIESSGINLFVIGVSCFSNVNTDIGAYALSTIIGCTMFSACFANIYVNSANGGTVSDNKLSGAASAIQLDTTANGFSIHNNVCSSTTTSATIACKGTNNIIHNNVLTGGCSIAEQTGANANLIHHNALLGGGTITLIGAATRILDNIGFNPVGNVTAPTVPASTTAIQNTFGYDCMVYILAGTITVISVGNTSGTTVATGLLSSAAGVSVLLRAGQWIKMTYSVAPTWKWFGL
jgi:hypothetical protein